MKYGFFLDGAVDVTVSNNTVYGATEAGLLARNIQRLTVSGNEFHCGPVAVAIEKIRAAIAATRQSEDAKGEAFEKLDAVSKAVGSPDFKVRMVGFMEFMGKVAEFGTAVAPYLPPLLEKLR